jgi:hypothetical protein
MATGSNVVRSLPRLPQRVGPHPQLPSLSGQKECGRSDDIFNRSPLSQSSLIGPSSLQQGHCRELHMFCAGLPRTRPTVAEASVEKKGIYSNDCNFSEYPASDGKRLKAASQVETVREDIKLFGRTWRKSARSVEIALTKLRWARRFPICPVVQMVSAHGQLRRPTVTGSPSRTCVRSHRVSRHLNPTALVGQLEGKSPENRGACEANGAQERRSRNLENYQLSSKWDTRQHPVFPSTFKRPCPIGLPFEVAASTAIIGRF